LWQLQSGNSELIFKNDYGKILSCHWIPNRNNLVSIATDGTILIWNIMSGIIERQYYTLSNENKNFCTISFDGKYIVSSSSFHQLLLWNSKFPALPQHRLNQSLDCYFHSNQINCAVFHPQKQELVLGDENGNLIFLKVIEPLHEL
jgi:WD40 repeat protein